jgi:hypothetical protein
MWSLQKCWGAKQKSALQKTFEQPCIIRSQSLACFLDCAAGKIMAAGCEREFTGSLSGVYMCAAALISVLSVQHFPGRKQAPPAPGCFSVETDHKQRINAGAKMLQAGKRSTMPLSYIEVEDSATARQTFRGE